MKKIDTIILATGFKVKITPLGGATVESNTFSFPVEPVILDHHPSTGLTIKVDPNLSSITNEHLDIMGRVYL